MGPSAGVVREGLLDEREVGQSLVLGLGVTLTTNEPATQFVEELLVGHEPQHEGGLALLVLREPASHAGGDDQLSVGKDRKSTRLNSSHVEISYAVFCLKKK